MVFYTNVLLPPRTIVREGVSYFFLFLSDVHDGIDRDTTGLSGSNDGNLKNLYVNFNTNRKCVNTKF